MDNYCTRMENMAEENSIPTLPLPAKVQIGAISGAFGRAIVFPLDMVKTRLQASNNGRYQGPFDCARKIFAREGGLRGFYKGLAPNLIGVTPGTHLPIHSHYHSLNMLSPYTSSQYTAQRKPYNWLSMKYYESTINNWMVPLNYNMKY